jgi:hypothetical protein
MQTTTISYIPVNTVFEQNRSCETQLLEFSDDVTKNMENSLQTDVLIMDFSKAFDKVSHNLLTHKLNCYGIGFTKQIHGYIASYQIVHRLFTGRRGIRLHSCNVWCTERVCSGFKSVPILHQ